MTIAPDSSLTCHRCGQVATVTAAVEAGLATGTVRKLSDHRVVQNRPDRA
jgi:microcompartment protein CcmL/EutN